MIYLESFKLPDTERETLFFIKEASKRTCYNNYYPFQIFPQMELTRLTFEPVTIFCGGNGSGKTTLLNLLAESVGAFRAAPYNRSSFWEDYLSLCQVKLAPGAVRSLRKAKIITSDDVFDYLLNIRTLNGGIDIKREELLSEYTDVKYAHFQMRSMDDYDQLKKVASARRNSGSGYVKDQLMKNIRNGSNGESAFEYFTQEIQSDTLYLLDEPENSLSPAKQMELMRFLEDSTRFYHCQFVISTHSPFLFAFKDAKIYNLDTCPVRTVHWTEIPGVRIYFDFFEAHRDEFFRQQERT